MTTHGCSRPLKFKGGLWGGGGSRSPGAERGPAAADVICLQLQHLNFSSRRSPPGRAGPGRPAAGSRDALPPGLGAAGPGGRAGGRRQEAAPHAPEPAGRLLPPTHTHTPLPRLRTNSSPVREELKPHRAQVTPTRTFRKRLHLTAGMSQLFQK